MRQRNGHARRKSGAHEVGICYQQFSNKWSAEPVKDLARAYELARVGLSDPNLGPAGQWNGHWLDAFVQLFHKRDYDAAVEAARSSRKQPEQSWR